MYENILIPTDGSDHATVAAEHAIALATQFDATVHTLLVIDARNLGITTPTNIDVEQLQDAYRRESEAAIDAVIRKADEADQPAISAIQIGVPHRTITEYVTDHGIDLVVMGTHGRTGVSRAFLGSVTEQVLRTLNVPVLVVHADEESSDER